MPLFQRISGILSKDNGNSTDASNKAILLLNKELDSNKSITLSLLNPHLKLKHVQNHLIEEYKKVLKEAKHEKIQTAQNRSLNDSYVPDENDEILTAVEVQGHITATNFKYSWQGLCKSAKCNDLHALDKIFNEDWMSIKNYKFDNLDFYCDVITEIYEANKDADVESITTWHKIFQNIINDGNRRASEHTDHKKAIMNVNRALDDGTPEDLYAALTNPHLELNIKVDKYAIPLLFEEMKLEKFECEKNLNESEIAASVGYYCEVAAVSRAVECGDERAVWEALRSSSLEVPALRSHCRRRYLAALSKALAVKIQQQCACPLLTAEDVRDAVDMVHIQDDHNEQCNCGKFLVSKLF